MSERTRIRKKNVIKLNCYHCCVTLSVYNKSEIRPRLTLQLHHYLNHRLCHDYFSSRHSLYTFGPFEMRDSLSNANLKHFFIWYDIKTETETCRECVKQWPVGLFKLLQGCRPDVRMCTAKRGCLCANLRMHCVCRCNAAGRTLRGFESRSKSRGRERRASSLKMSTGCSLCSANISSSDRRPPFSTADHGQIRWLMAQANRK